MIKLDDYPQLRLISWSVPCAAELSDEEAFDLYEANWAFVDIDALQPNEKALIERLKAEIGKGMMYV